MVQPLTKLDGKKDNKVERFEVTGCEAKVVEIRGIDKQVEELQGKRTKLREVIIESVQKLRKAWEKKGKMYKSFTILSQDGVPATVLFKNAFSRIDPANELAMREALGKYFDELYSKSTSTALRKNADIDELKKLLGARFAEFFDQQTFIDHKEGFMEKRADLRSEVTKPINDALDSYTKDMQAQPDLRMK